jgi:endonuclease G
MTIKRLTTSLAAILILCATAWAADHCPSCEVSDAKRSQYDALLTLTASQMHTAESRHIPYGMPIAAATATHEYMLHQKDYVTWYDDDLRVPLWVAYRLTKKNAIAVRERLDCFRPDPRLPANSSAECDDYLEPTFDQGHLAPNADFKTTEAMMINTYIYSNITPQHKNFNEHTWERLETLVRMWASKRGDLFVITGAVFDQNGDHLRDSDNSAQRVATNNRVAIPTHFYKIIFQKHLLAADESIAILLPHDDAKHTGDAWVTYVTDHITTIGEIEQVSGVNFLPGLSASKRAAMESFRAPALWPKE